jgi:hypothetical protein
MMKIVNSFFVDRGFSLATYIGRKQMESKDVKKAVELAEKELQEKQIQEVKEIVKRTLEKLEKAKKQKAEVDEVIKYLKMDLDDLKEGRLDRIEERQLKDPKAKEVSVVIIIKKEVVKETTIINNPTYVPVPYYPKPWNEPYYVYYSDNSNKFLCQGGNVNFSSGDDVQINYTSNALAVPLTGQITKNNSSGAYMIENKIVHLR